jgi:hypothetical protein
MFRAASLLLLGLPLAANAAPGCPASELRVSSPDGAWFDVVVDGREVLSSRVLDGQQAVRLSAGRHHVRVTDFMGQTWSTQSVVVGCGEVLVGEVSDGLGLHGISRFNAASGPRCRSASLSVVGRDGVWFDLVVDGATVLEQRSFDGPALVRGLTPGRHHVRVTSFMGEVWSEGTIDVGCGDPLALIVREGRGLR